MILRIRGGGNGAPALTPAARASLLVFFVAACCLTAVACGNGDDTGSPAAAAAKPADAGTDATAHSSDAGEAGAGATDSGGSDATMPHDAGVASATFSLSPIQFGSVNCSGTATQTLSIKNTGSDLLTVSDSTTGTAFSPSPATLSIAPGASQTVTVAAIVPGFATAGTPLIGALNLFTNDPAHSNVSIALSATPSGATLVATPSTGATSTGNTLGTAPAIGFASSEVNTPAPAQTFSLTNIGNASAQVTFGTPSDPEFSLQAPASGSVAASPGSPVTATFGFTPSSAAGGSATSQVQITGVTCGTSVSVVSLSGKGALGSITGYPSTIDFGPAECGGAVPTPKQITLTNAGSVDAHVTVASVTGPTGFSTSATVGQVVSANGGTLLVAFTAPAVASPSPLTPITATVSVQTDADATPQSITLTEEPQGAVLAFDTSPTPNFGSFGQAVILQGLSQNFNVTNTGNEAVGVALAATASNGFDAGAEAPPTFSVANTAFSVAGGGTQATSVTYAATAPGNQTGTLSMTATGTLCGSLPAAIPLSGSGVGGGPSVAPTSLSFGATCGAAAPPPQTFTVSNSGTADMSWSLGDVTGQGAASYAVSASPGPGTLHPGASATVTVTAAAVPSPALNTSPSAYAAQIAITTDVPFDNPHVVTLGETPLGDQLSFSVGQLRFGQFPINTTTLGQTITVANAANVGSPAANLSLSLSGGGAPGFTVTPTSISNLAPGGAVSNPVFVTFEASAPSTYPATLGITTTDGLCTALPDAVGLIGTGTQGKVSVSVSTLAFGTDASDPLGLVNCGITGLPHTFTVSNSGNQAFQITGLTFGLGSSSPYVLSGPGAAAAATVPIHGSTTITVTPNAIPSTVTNPNDASPFTDTLTLTTNAALDSPHTIALAMQARGAVIDGTPAPVTTWNFGTVGGGSIGTFANTITNTGNAAVSIALTRLKQPTIFGLQSNPTVGAANAVSPVVGEFTPPSANGQWSDQGTLVVTPAQVFCEPLPVAWTNVPISVSGSSNGNPPVTLSGTLTFPSSDCGSAAPAGRAVTLTNATNQAYTFSASFSSGAFYTASSASDAGSGVLPSKGVATIIVTPKTVTPGAGVQAGSAPYLDDLVITIASTPVTTFTIPISWTLNGAVLSLPNGLGTNRDSMGNPFYAADTRSGFQLPLVNTGTATANVSFGLPTSPGFGISPAGSIAVQPGIKALPQLNAATSDTACPALTPGFVAFLYSGPVCQPLPVSQVSVESCAGTF